MHTGDRSQLDEAGYLRITGRVKDIFKTSKGKYVATAPIEGKIAKTHWVEQVCLMGSNLDQPLALVELSPAARQQPRELLGQSLAEHLHAVNQRLEAHERVSHFYLVSEAWTVDNGSMTPTMKIRRNVLEVRYAEAIAAMPGDAVIVWER